jgi:hypothetical protein
MSIFFLFLFFQVYDMGALQFGNLNTSLAVPPLLGLFYTVLGVSLFPGSCFAPLMHAAVHQTYFFVRASHQYRAKPTGNW